MLDVKTLWEEVKNKLPTKAPMEELAHNLEKGLWSGPDSDTNVSDAGIEEFAEKPELEKAATSLKELGQAVKLYHPEKIEFDRPIGFVKDVEGYKLKYPFNIII